MTDRDFDPESNMNSPLSELGLLEYVDKKKGIISHKTLNVKNIPIYFQYPTLLISNYPYF